MIEDGKISITSFIITLTAVILLAPTDGGFSAGWSNDTFLENLISAPIFFAGALLCSGIFGIVAFLIEFYIKKIEDEFTGKAKIIVIIITIILAFIIYAIVKTYY